MSAHGFDSTGQFSPRHRRGAPHCAEIERALYEVKKVIVGQERMIERVMVGLVAGGHVLLEGVPGLAKTLAVKSLSQALEVGFRRVQFTPDLVPADLVGTRVYQPQSGEFQTEWEMVMTGASIATLPTLLVFVALQRYIVRGVMLTGLKG